MFPGAQNHQAHRTTRLSDPCHTFLWVRLPLWLVEGVSEGAKFCFVPLNPQFPFPHLKSWCWSTCLSTPGHPRGWPTVVIRI